MPKIIPPLTEAQVRNAKPRQKLYKLFDGGGLYLEVAPTGSRSWRLKFRQQDGKENRLTFGPYPEISLQDARERRLAARRLIATLDDVKARLNGVLSADIVERQLDGTDSAAGFSRSRHNFVVT
ncbi:DUF4102 domain-containing protein [Duganella sp. BJB1802]|uniref:Arm DNA-binding domain-containing protein n=1 Tax=Duganella sp. BJB1802 TaxID=2744575 RepID=UPI001592CB7D|nr:Arm DNA-binding domain-containing protein [Duganella sp. BJB1802]NVD73272.1 DUF4102 domain-containing protein [Duganella sp. BJB1802]